MYVFTMIENVTQKYNTYQNTNATDVFMRASERKWSYG